MAYIDDLPILSKNNESYYKHSEIFLERLQIFQLYVSPVKSEFFKEENDFIDMLI